MLQILNQLQNQLQALPMPVYLAYDHMPAAQKATPFVVLNLQACQTEAPVFRSEQETVPFFCNSCGYATDANRNACCGIIWKIHSGDFASAHAATESAKRFSFLHPKQTAYSIGKPLLQPASCSDSFNLK